MGSNEDMTLDEAGGSHWTRKQAELENRFMKTRRRKALEFGY